MAYDVRVATVPEMIPVLEDSMAIPLVALGIVPLLLVFLAGRVWMRARRRAQELLHDPITIEFSGQPGMFAGRRATKSAGRARIDLADGGPA